jgi:glycosyltransferase involved in cell wall biosynthesis
MVGFTPSLMRVPLILYLRGWYTPDMMPGYGRWLCRKRTAGIFALSHATKSALICSGIEGQKIHVLHNPIDVDEYLELSRRPLARELPQQARPVRILLPADIIRTKGQHTAVEAMRQILARGHDAVLWLAGEHAWPQGENRDYFQGTQELARQLGVADRVVWLGRRDDMPQVMAAATMVVFPSHTEGQGRVLLEAMSLSKPVAACPSGGILDMVCENVTGLLFDVDDAHGLSDCVCRLAGNTAFAAQLGRQGVDYIRMTFTPKQQLEKALKVMSSVAGLGNAPLSSGERGNGA